MQERLCKTCTISDQDADLLTIFGLGPVEALYAKYRDRGLVVLGFPSNDFGGQEPGTEAQIKNFCRLTYSVEFPTFAKTQVKKGTADP
jgi:glutathione peroxidase